jgi:hypothetical protein
VTKDEYLAEVDRAMSTVTDLLLAARMGVEKQFNPMMVQISLETAKVFALAAIAAAGVPVSGGVLEVATANRPPDAPAQRPANGSGLVVPG